MANPLNKENAIDSAVFMLKFNREFSFEENKAISGVAEVLKSELPNANELKRFSLNIDTVAEKQSGEVEISGLSLQRFQPDGTPAWELTVVRDSIVATCRAYSSWTAEKETAIKFIKAVLHLLERSDNLINGVILQITDRFIEAAPGSYNIENVFNKESLYLTKNVLTQGPLWHVFQGWFDEPNDVIKGRCLNVLNISTNVTREHVSNIEHSVQYQISEPKEAISYNQDTSSLSSIFDDLHEKNKAVIKELLCREQLKAIGL
jgi:uncharacterized protein (TIGR04255 family)